MLPEPDAALCAALAQDLRDAGFTSEGLRDAWGAVADASIGRGLRGPALRALTGDTRPVAVLGRLLVLGMPQPAAAVASALPRTGPDGLARLGLAADTRADAGGDTRGDDVRPTVIIRPQAFADAAGDGEWWIASDLDEAAGGAGSGGALPEDHVLGIGGASLTLLGLQLPGRVGRILDVGTGCGIQALRARRAAQEVVATDVSARALWFARLNALLNGVPDIEVRAGSLFEPVAGEVFDRVVSNPPFVITPRAAGVPAYEYRDGGMVGDGLVEAFVTGVGAHLAPGGVAQLLGNWEYRDGADGRDGLDGLDRVREWVAASPVPLDAWIIEREVLDPLSYAELWIRDGATAPGSPEFAELVDAWLDDFAARGVTEVGFGYMLLRRPADGAPTLSRYERLTQALDPAAALGAHLAESLAAHDAVVALDDAGVAASVLVVAADVTEARHHLPGAESPSVIELRQGGGFARTITADPALAALVGACDDDLPVGALIDAIAQLLEVDAAELRRELIPAVRELLFTGFLHLT